MMPPVSRIPSQSVLFGPSQTASYVDCVTHPLPEDCASDALALYFAIMRPAPRWLNAMLVVRDRMVRPFGLKAVGGFGGNLRLPFPFKRATVWTSSPSSTQALMN